MESRLHQIFPSLTEDQFAILQRYGERRQVAAGTVLFTQGERHIPMFVVLAGKIEIARGSAIASHVIGTHGPGSFTGEAGTLAGRAAIATGTALVDCELIVIDEAALRTLVISEADLSETIMRAYILRRMVFIEDETGGLILIGSQDDAETLGLRSFITRNGQPAAYFDVNRHAESADLMARFGIAPGETPAIILPDGQVFRRPTIRALADATGISPDRLDGRTFDVVVVGAGPGGLAAAVYAASEGLAVAVLERSAPGGQAGTSSKIENYFGFPTGVSGQALAGRGLSQARKFGAEVAVPVFAVKVDCGGGHADGYAITLDNDETIHARTIVVATGARYRKPPLPELARYEGRGIYYSAAFMEATFCRNEEIVVVGGGNSAGQAAVFLSRYAQHVHICVRGPGLAATMSHYLIQRIDAAPNITLHAHTEVCALHGDGHLEEIALCTDGAAPHRVPVRHLFLFLGAEPNTDWLNGCVALDDRQFVLTGADVPPQAWCSARAPLALETSRPGIFAVGDVRSGSVKRVAAAVGEGATAVASLHQVLAL
jgi:thioredoxin reductase (NADPH)